MENVLVFVPNLGCAAGVAGHHFHQGYGGVHIGIQRQQRQYRIQQFRHAVTVCTDHLGVFADTLCREVAVSDYQSVAVAHFVQGL